VTETDSATVYKRWAYCLQKAEVEEFKEKPHHKTPYYDFSFFVEKGPAADASGAQQP
jgi:hypothetical protein